MALIQQGMFSIQNEISAPDSLSSVHARLWQQHKIACIQQQYRMSEQRQYMWFFSTCSIRSK